MKFRSKLKSFTLFSLLLLISLGHPPLRAQNPEKKTHELKVSALFNPETDLKLKLSYTKKDLLKLTNDSTYIKSIISYAVNNGNFQNMDVELRARGHYRRANCYYVPLWLKMNKKVSKGTVFEDDKKVKIVLPCAKSNSSNDDIIKEFLAYKIFESLSPYYFQTKLVPIQLEEQEEDKKVAHQLLGILIQDNKKLASSYDGNVIKRNIHAKSQDPICSVRNDFFQYMIGNTDYSITYRHNEKLFFIDHKIVPIPYDFDMSGLVNSSYAVVSVVNNVELPISRVTQRMYRGFQQDEKILEQVRQEFLQNQQKIYDIMDELEIFLKDPKEFTEARKFIDGFYETISDDKKFSNRILKRGRTDLKE